MKLPTRIQAIRWPLTTAAVLLSISAAVLALHRSPARDNGPALADQNAYSGADTQGPVRMARFSDNRGEVMFRPASTNLWAAASVNQPLRQGASIYLQPGADSEVQFDDGAAMRLGYQAAVTLQTMYSDSQGEFTEIRLTTGAMTLHLRHGSSIYQVDTPFASVRADGPAEFRVGVGAALTVADYAGRAQVQSSSGSRWVDPGQTVRLGDSSAPIAVQSPRRSDSFDRWCSHRDNVLYGDQISTRVLPSDIALVSGNLSDYGSWYNDPSYGSVWRPTEPVGWRPYHSGRWVWVAPIGWMWVAYEPWGWAPYHYGSWAYVDSAWEWIPGPACQYWSPAVVSLSYYNGGYAWCPLGPSEVRYPAAFDIGFGSGNWWLNFSIGGACNYYPSGYGDYYSGDPWNTGYVNRVTNINITNIYNNGAVAGAWYNGAYTGGYQPGYQGGYLPSAGINTAFGGSFIPQNARFAAGATFATAAAFGGRGVYRGLNAGNVTPFTRGRIMGAPRSGFQPLSGPRGGATLASFSASRRAWSSSRPSMVLSRGVYRAALPAPVAALSSHRYAGSIRTLATRTAFGQTARPSAFGGFGGRASSLGSGAAGRNAGFAGTSRIAGMPAFGRSAQAMGFGARSGASRNSGVPANVFAARRSMGFSGYRGGTPATAHGFNSFTRPSGGIGRGVSRNSGMPANVFAARRSMGFSGYRGGTPATAHGFGSFTRPSGGIGRGAPSSAFAARRSMGFSGSSHAAGRPAFGRSGNLTGFGTRRAPANVGAARRSFGRAPQQFRQQFRQQYRAPQQFRQQYRAPQQFRQQYRAPQQFRQQYRAPQQFRQQYRAPQQFRQQYRAPQQ
ncbi:MAG: FecR domain-containing protein, partial [Armatimonadetes bacterium]|nr:FecR domain-containing protein [Armatimonadota bacterium]